MGFFKKTDYRRGGFVMEDMKKKNEIVITTPKGSRSVIPLEGLPAWVFRRSYALFYRIPCEGSKNILVTMGEGAK